MDNGRCGIFWGIGEGDFWCEESKEIVASEFAIHDAQICGKYEGGE